jgi:hypothetical protein
VAVNESGNTYDRFIYWECADLPDDMKKETLSVYVRDKNFDQTVISAIETQVQSLLLEAQMANPPTVYTISDLVQVKQGDEKCEYVGN